MEHISAQVQKVISSTSPTYLKPLYEACRNHGIELVGSWLSQNHDLVALLASTILEQVELGLPFAMELLGLLSTVQQLRDAFLLQSPNLLHDVLCAASDAGVVERCASHASVSLLGYPLPEDIALPASAQPFLTRLFEHLTHSPNLETAEAVFRVLDGAGRVLLDKVPRAKLLELSHYVRCMVSNARSDAESLVNLFCLAIMGKIHRAYEGSPTHRIMPEESIHQLHTADKSKLTKFFTGDGDAATSTILLIVMQVIHACNADSKLVIIDRARRIHLARCILDCVDHNTIRAQISAKPAVFSKLLERVSLQNLPSELQLEATAFACMMASVIKTTSSKLNAQCERIALNLVDELPIGISNQIMAECFHVVLEYSCNNINETVWSHVVERILVHLREIQLGGFSRMFQLQQLITVLTTISRRCSVLRTAVIQLLSRNSDKELFTTLFNSTFTSANSASTQLQIEFQISLMSFLLGVTLSCQDDEKRLSPDLALKLLVREQYLSKSFRSLQDSKQHLPRHQNNFSNLGNLSSESKYCSRNWQEVLSSEINKQAVQHRKTVIEMLSGALHDLQARCDDAERPLRDEQAKHQETKRELELIQTKISQLETLRVSLEEHIRQLRQEARDTGCELDEASSQVGKKDLQISELQERLKETKRKAEEESKNARQIQTQECVELQVRIAEQVETIDEQNKELETRSSRILSLLNEEQANKDSIDEFQSRVKEFDKNEQRLTSKISELEDTMNHIHAIHEQKTAELQQQKVTAAESLRKLQEANDKQVEVLEQEALRRDEILQAKISRQESEFDALKAQHLEAIAAKDNIQNESDKKVKSQGRQLRAKDAEIKRLKSALASIQNIFAENNANDSEEGIVDDPSPTREIERSATRESVFRLPESQSDLKHGRHKLQQTREARGLQTIDQISPPEQSRQPLRETTSNVLKGVRMRSRRQTEAMGMSSHKRPSRNSTRKSLAVMNADLLSPSRRKQKSTIRDENILIDMDELGFSTIRTADSYASTEEF